MDKTKGKWTGKATVSLLTLGALLLQGTPAFAARPEMIYSANVSCRQIALTYDTEFAPTTQKLADTLDSLHVRATWFFMAKYMPYYPAVVRQVVAHHEIGNHTWDHPEMPKLAPREMRWQIDRAERQITGMTGVSPKPYFRPPYGAWNNTMLDVVGAAGYTHVIMWSIDTLDWSGKSAQEIDHRIVRNAFPGAIVLMHGLGKHTAEGTQLAVQDLRRKGYEFVTVSELLGKSRHWRDFGGDGYVVQAGDTWNSVGRCLNVTGGRLSAFNGQTTLRAGTSLKVPHRDEVIVRLNGERLEFPQYSRLRGIHALAHPQLAQRLGATVETRHGQIHIRKGAKHIVIGPGDRIARVDGIPVDMGAYPVSAGGVTLVPARFVAEQLGARVTWHRRGSVLDIQLPNSRKLQHRL